MCQKNDRIGESQRFVEEQGGAVPTSGGGQGDWAGHCHTPPVGEVEAKLAWGWSVGTCRWKASQQSLQWEVLG